MTVEERWLGGTSCVLHFCYHERLEAHATRMDFNARGQGSLRQRQNKRGVIRFARVARSRFKCCGRTVADQHARYGASLWYIEWSAAGLETWHERILYVVVEQREALHVEPALRTYQAF